VLRATQQAGRQVAAADPAGKPLRLLLDLEGKMERVMGIEPM
jgi:hypothetical protein